MDFDNSIVETESVTEVGFDNLMVVFVTDSCFVLDFGIEYYSVLVEFVIVPEFDSSELVAECKTEFVGYFAN